MLPLIDAVRFSRGQCLDQRICMIQTEHKFPKKVKGALAEKCCEIQAES